MAKTASDWRALSRKIRRICFDQYREQTGHVKGDRIHLSIDVTPCPKLFSGTLPDRQAIIMPNPAPPQQFQLSEGYNLSCINLGNFDGKWSLPMDMQRVGIEETSSACALRQLDNLMDDPELGFCASLVVAGVDNGYANVPFIGPLYQRRENLVVVARMKRGSKTYTRVAAPSDDSYQRKYYGQAHYNIMDSDVKHHKADARRAAFNVERTSISQIGPDETISYERQMGRRQRPVKVIVERFNDRLLKSKNGPSMKDKPVDILRIRYLNQEGGNIYRYEMYLVLSGARRGEVGTREAQENYVSRSDIEAYFRIAKNRLLLTRFQSSQLQHYDNFLLVVQLASWMSYLTAKEATQVINPWERYAPQPQAEGQRLTMARSIRAASAYYATLDLRVFWPPERSGGTGRKKGTKMPRKKRHKKVRKRPVKG